MIKLIVGLGNPGTQYERTRHNAGFLFVDRLLRQFGGTWGYEAKFQALISSCQIGSQSVVLLKPQTFMNKSGEAVGKVARYFKFQPEEILVVHDELDFDAGVIKIKVGGGHAGHNGLRSVIAHLGSRDFMRLRVGIGKPAVGRSVADYVLSKFSNEGWERIDGAYQAVDKVIEQIIFGEIASAMNALHG